MSATIDWGLLSHPIRAEVPEGAPPWKDNAFLCFWDPAHDLCATLHVSTSPNGEGRRARLSVQHDGRVTEIVEPLEAGTFSSASIAFDGGSSFSVSHPLLAGEISSRPHLALGDFSGDASPGAFALVKSEPLTHYEQAARVNGRLRVRGVEVPVDGEGFRDRSWGWRDESASLSEYFGYMWVFPGFGVCGNRNLSADGVDSVDLRLLTETESIAATTVSITRDAAGLFAATRIGFADGRTLQARCTERTAGFWCPMGWERTGPTLGAYDEFCHVRTSDGAEGFGLIEQGIVKQLF